MTLGSVYIDNTNCYYIVIGISSKFTKTYYFCISPVNGRLCSIIADDSIRLATKKEIEDIKPERKRISIRAIFFIKNVK